MPYEIGEHVHVRSLGKGIVREVRNGARYAVEIKGLSVLVAENDLSPVYGGKGRPAAPAPVIPVIADLPLRAHAAASIDLHGMTTDAAVEALGAFLSDAILAALEEVRVIHGRSGGRLKAAVHARLKGTPSIRGFRLDPANPGVTIVRL